MSAIDVLKKNGINSVWHFTDERNIDSIARYGILSLHELDKSRISAYCGADGLSHSLDRNRGLHKYVHLAFINDHPMFYSAKKRGSIVYPVWIELDLSILHDKKTKFSDEVASKSGAGIYDIDLVDQKIDFAKMADEDFEVRKNAKKAEILVPAKIETRYIKNIYRAY